jgi:hypothetical protein
MWEVTVLVSTKREFWPSLPCRPFEPRLGASGRQPFHTIGIWSFCSLRGLRGIFVGRLDGERDSTNLMGCIRGLLRISLRLHVFRRIAYSCINLVRALDRIHIIIGGAIIPSRILIRRPLIVCDCHARQLKLRSARQTSPDNEEFRLYPKIVCAPIHKQASRDKRSLVIAKTKIIRSPSELEQPSGTRSA